MMIIQAYYYTPTRYTVFLQTLFSSFGFGVCCWIGFPPSLSFYFCIIKVESFFHPFSVSFFSSGLSLPPLLLYKPPPPHTLCLQLYYIIRTYFIVSIFMMHFHSTAAPRSCCCDTFLPSLPTISGRNMTNNNRAYYPCRCVYTSSCCTCTIKLESIYKYFFVFLSGRRPWRIFESKFRQIKMERIFIILFFFPIPVFGLICQ